MILSALGAGLNLEGHWTPPVGLDVEGWRHNSSMARDHDVRVAYKGFLFPFGHRASLIKETSRSFCADRYGNPAFLRQRWFIVVQEPDRSYPLTGIGRFDRQFPFSRVQIITLITPSLQDPSQCDIPYTNANVRVSGRRDLFRVFDASMSEVFFHIVAADREGNKVEFSIPLIFVGDGLSTNPAAMNAAQDNYIKGDPSGTNHHLGPVPAASLQGQTVCFTDKVDKGDTELSTELLKFGAQTPDVTTPMDSFDRIHTSSDYLFFYPRLEQASAHIPSIQLLAGNDTPAVFTYWKSYLENGFDDLNYPGEVFAKLVENNPLNLLFSGHSDRSGGFLSPDIQISGLSWLLGPVGGHLDPVGGHLDPGGRHLVPGGGVGTIGSIATGEFKASDYFSGSALSPKLFGVFGLGDIVAGVTKFTSQKYTNVPRFSFTEQPLPGTGTLIRTATYDWQPILQDGGTVFETNGNTSLLVHAEANTVVDAATGSTSILKQLSSCNLSNFTLNLIGKEWPASFIILNFDDVYFDYESGQKAVVQVGLTSIDFVGVLAFVQALKDLIPCDGFSNLPSVEISEQGVSLNFSLALPNLSIGVFSLTNLSLVAGFSIPFFGGPLNVSFGFCRRESPFLLTVSMFGGGGFFGMVLNANGLQMLEAAFEFGASLSVDFGVASGGVHVLAGIYYKQAEDHSAALSGYFRMGGESECARPGQRLDRALPRIVL